MPDQDHDDLRALLHETADSVRPADRLGEIRRRTRTPARPRRYAVVLAAGVATAAVVAAVVGGVAAVQAWRHDEGSQVASPGPGDTTPTAVYFVSDTSTGARLFREFQRSDAAAGSPTVLAALELMTVDHGPDDPDYRTAWPVGAFTSAVIEPDRIVVGLDDTARDRPAGLPEGDAALAVQQAVYTADAAAGASLPVAFEADGAPVRTVLGNPVGALVARDNSATVVSPVTISDPVQGETVTGPLVARGTLGRTVTRVVWSVTADGGRRVAHGVARALPPGPANGTTLGAPGWRTDPIDLGSVPAGSYRFTARVEDVGQTSASPVRYSDDRTILIK